MKNRFVDIEVRPISQGDIVYFSVWDTLLDQWLGQGSVDTVRNIFWRDDCEFCDRTPGRSYGRCEGYCGAPIPK